MNQYTVATILAENFLAMILSFSISDYFMNLYRFIIELKVV